MYTVLYVDDESTLLEIGKIFLERSGQFSVDIITSAPAALALLNTKNYDAIIADYQMPGMDGIEFLKKVRSSGNTIPFILFTGRGREEIVIQALNEGADFYLQKGGEPVSQFTELAHKIRQAVQQRTSDASIHDLERREADIINFLPDATFAIDRSGRIIAWNRAIEEMTGVSAVEMLGKGDYEYAIPFYGQRRPVLIDLIYESDEFITKNYAHIIHEKDSLIADTTLPVLKGKPVTLMGKASPLFNRHGKVIGAIESIRDITEREQAVTELRAAHEQLTAAEEELRSQYDELAQSERQIRQSEERFRTIVENMQDIVYRSDREGTLIMASPSWAVLLGYESVDECLGKNIATAFYMYPETRQKFLDAINRDGAVKDYEVVLRRRDGTPVTVSTSSHTYYDESGAEQGIEGVFRDISDRRRTEQLLRDSENTLSAIVRSSPVPQFVIDKDHKVIQWNTALESYSGIRAGEVIGTSQQWRAFYPEERPCLSDLLVEGQTEKITQLYSGKYTPSSLIEDAYEVTDFFPGMGKEGTWLYFTAAPIWDAKGTIIGAVETLEDITGRKRAEEKLQRKNEELAAMNEEIRTSNEQLAALEEELRGNLDELTNREQALRKSEERYRNVVEDQTEFISRFLPDGTHVFVNEAYCQYFGLKRDEIIGHRFRPRIPAEDRERVRRFFESLTPGHPVDSIEHRIVMPDGSIRWQWWSDRAIFDVSGTITEYQSVGRDITARYLSEEYLARISALKQELLGAAPLEEKLKRITDFLVELLGVDFARIWISGRGDLCDNGCIHAPVTEGPHACRNRASCLHLVASSGRYTHTDGGHRRVPFGAYKIGRIASGEETWFVTNDVTRDPRVHDHEWAASLGLVSFAGFRLVSPDRKPIGVLAFFSRQPISPEITGFLQDIATTASQVVRTGMVEMALRESEERYRTIFETTGTATVVIEENNIISLANAEFAQLSGFSKGDIEGKKRWTGFVVTEDLERMLAQHRLRRQNREKALTHYEFRFVTRSGDIRTIYLSIDVIPGTKKSIASLQDITERRRAAEVLASANRKLRLLSSITRHDINNQLTLMMGLLALLETEQPDTSFSEYFKKINTSAQRVFTTIQFTKTYEEIGVNAPVWQDCRTLADTAARQVPLGKVMVKNDIPDGTEVFADPLIVKVWYNLIDNAVRYGGKITTIRFSAQESGDGHLIVCEDDGDGIPADEKERIFERGFGRNTGLGLFLAREILGITGLTIRETGEPGKGSRFEILVPKGAYQSGERP